MKPEKQAVYLRVPPFKTSKLWVSDKETEQLEFVKEQEAFVFTSEELNEYTANVIKQALETAADKAQLYRQNSAYKHSKFNLKIEKCLNYNVGIDLETISNTFEETYKKFEI